MAWQEAACFGAVFNENSYGDSVFPLRFITNETLKRKGPTVRIVRERMDPYISLSTKAKRRTRTSPEEKRVLENHFLHNPNPNQRQKEDIAHTLQMEVKNVHFWFQNRRAQFSKQKKLSGDPGYSSNSSGGSSRRTDEDEEAEGISASWMADRDCMRNDKTRFTALLDKDSRSDSQRLPPISSLMNRPVEDRDRGCVLAPLIPFFFHHTDFGIESCMVQWRKGQNAT